jgi:dolichol-phosphate mannosyltransferase
LPAAPATVLSIIVPTYNERHRLPELVAAIFSAYQSAALEGEIVIVDDNSPDGTGDVAEELAKERTITVVHRAGKLGLGTAVIEGFAAASAAVVGVIDADLSHPPALLPQMFAIMQQERADVVIGSR